MQVLVPITQTSVMAIGFLDGQSVAVPIWSAQLVQRDR